MFAIATTAGEARSTWSRLRQHDLDLARYRPLTSPRDGTKAPNHRPSRHRPSRRRPNPRRANPPRRPPPAPPHPPPRAPRRRGHPPPPCPTSSTVGAAAVVAGWAGPGSAAAIGAAPIATAAAPAANIGVMYFNPIRIME